MGITWEFALVVAGLSLVTATFIKYGFEYLMNRQYAKVFEDATREILTYNREELILEIADRIADRVEFTEEYYEEWEDDTRI